MNTLLLLAVLSCPDPRILNMTQTWEERDHKQLLFSEKRCGEIYPKSPCLALFYKTGEGSYYVVCSKQKKETKREPEVGSR